MKYRTETDTMGEVKIPENKYYGAQTMRAVRNFPVSGLTLQPEFVKAQAIIKKAAAQANMEGGKLDYEIGDALIKAADEILEGKLADEFVVDVYQAGAGTSQNMNVNEVLANRAIEILGGNIGDYSKVHPNDHVNMGQSTNDTIHAAIHIAAVNLIDEKLLPAMERLLDGLDDRAEKLDGVIKTGRTHLQDAVPIRLGQEFSAYATMIKKSIARVQAGREELLELCIGGSAVGTSINTSAVYVNRITSHIAEFAEKEFRQSENLFEGMQSFDTVVSLSGVLRALAANLNKMANDLRLLSSGPRTGFGEINLPPVQPGSSIMPGKVNPVLPEMLNMVCYQVFGCDTTVSMAAQAGQLELNVMMPVIAYNFLHEIQILAGGIDAFAKKCVSGITANKEVCEAYAEKSSALATALNPHIGYEKAAALAYEALEKDTTIRELVVKKKILSKKEADEILNLRKMTEPPVE